MALLLDSILLLHPVRRTHVCTREAVDGDTELTSELMENGFHSVNNSLTRFLVPRRKVILFEMRIKSSTSRGPSAVPHRRPAGRRAALQRWALRIASKRYDLRTVTADRTTYSTWPAGNRKDNAS